MEGAIFTGERWEAYTGLLFLRARYYEPGTGRFTSQDPWPGNVQQPQTLHRWIYTENNPVDRIDPTGYFSDEAIKRSLRGQSFDEAFGVGSDDMGRWGLFALLRDATDGDRLLARNFNLPAEDPGDFWKPLWKDSDGEWVMNCEVCSEQIVFSNAKTGNSMISLGQFLQVLNAKAERVAYAPGINKYWRQDTLRFHWYELIARFPDATVGSLYSDFWGKSSLPDLWLLDGFQVPGVPVGAALISDMYGNTYASTAIGTGKGVGVAIFWEGYADTGWQFRRHQFSEGELRNVIEGWGWTTTGSTPFGGIAHYWNSQGEILFYGGNNISIGVGANVSYTWYIGNDWKSKWDWINDQRYVPRYGSEVQGEPNAPGPGWCLCE